MQQFQRLGEDLQERDDSGEEADYSDIPGGISEASLRKWKPTDIGNIILVAGPRTVSSASSSEHLRTPHNLVKDSFRRRPRERPTGMRTNERPQVAARATKP